MGYCPSGILHVSHFSNLLIISTKYFSIEFFFQTKPVYIPEKSKDYKPREPLEFIRNIWGIQFILFIFFFATCMSNEMTM
jgi:hypothetical protein